MKDELKITKEDLVTWLDRPPSNEDLDLCSYLANALEKRQYYLITKELKKWLNDVLNELKENDVYDRTSYESGQIIAIESVIAKIEELGKGIK